MSINKKDNTRNKNKNRAAVAKTSARKPVKPAKTSKTARPKADNTSATKQSAGATAFLWILILIFLAGLVIWQRAAVETFINQLFSGTAAVFGWGLLLVILGIIIAVAIFKREAVAAFARQTTFIYWYRWLGAIMLILAGWGLLALGGAGGSFGLAIIGSDTGAGGWLRIIGLVLLAFVLLAPAVALSIIKGLGSLISRPFRVDKTPPHIEGSFRPYPSTPQVSRQAPSRMALPGDRPRPPQTKPPLPQEATSIPSSLFVAGNSPAVKKADTAETDSNLKKDTKTTEDTSPDDAEKEETRDLKQVAQDVWRKYGETASLLTSDGWRLPPVEILDYTPEIEYGEADNQQRARMIEDALGSYGVEASVVQINAGPTVTQFGVEPGWDRRIKELKEKDKDGNPVTRQIETGRTRVKVDRISSLANDLALALAAPSIRIEAPIPGKSLVGIEVPNTLLGSVSMRAVIETTAFQKLQAKAPLAMALGKGAGGEAVVGDLAKMPHLLIAGSTGSGKTVCLNAIICCLMMNNTPNEVKFIMIDPKRVELTAYNSMPHLAAPVIVDVDKAIGSLKWLAGEMDRRYKQMAAVSARNIDAYNKKSSEKMPYLILVIDELADLMMAGFDDVEHLLCRLAQMARAVGIHLVVATQRPSVDVITGLIKANFPTRISFAVTSQVDSRTILDSVGAEKLLGRGDMLYMPTDAAKPKRLQGCFLSDAETERLVYFWNGQTPEPQEPILKIEDIPTFTQPGTAADTVHQRDSLFETAMKLARDTGTISASFLQRKLHIGYPRAARLADEVKEALEEDYDDGGAEIPKDDDY